MKAYCVKCKAKTEMADAVESEVNGRKALKGKCAKCGTGMFKLLPGPIAKGSEPRSSSVKTMVDARRRGPLGVRV